MRKANLYIGMSLDGYISDNKGNVDWMVGHSSEEEMIDTYSEFVKSVDTVIMGWNTYEKIVTDLSPEEWIYKDFQTYVITHQNVPNQSGITFTSLSPAHLIRSLKEDLGKDIWICGGANIVGQLIQEDLIDTYHIAILPTILGNGIRLFDKTRDELKLKLVDRNVYNGIVELIYIRR